MKLAKLLVALTFAASLTGCVGAVIGVAVDTTTAVIKAPFQLTGAVLGVAADTAGTVIATPFRMVDAAVGGSHHHGRSYRYRNHDDRGHDDHEHEDHPVEQYQYPADNAE